MSNASEDKALLEKVCVLTGVARSGVGQTPKDVIAWLYGVLNTLDSKANGLLRFNGIMLAVSVAVLGFWNASRSPEALLAVSNTVGFAAIIVLACSLISSVLCLLIVKISWHFLGHVTTDEQGAYDFRMEIEKLARVAIRRTRYYWIAWWTPFIMFGTVLVAFLLIMTE